MLLIPLFAAVTFASQRPESGPPRMPPPPTASRATAVLAVRAPVIDGRDDDDVWRQAAPITEFREWQPVGAEGRRFELAAARTGSSPCARGQPAAPEGLPPSPL